MRVSISVFRDLSVESPPPRRLCAGDVSTKTEWTSIFHNFYSYVDLVCVLLLWRSEGRAEPFECERRGKCKLQMRVLPRVNSLLRGSERGSIRSVHKTSTGLGAIRLYFGFGSTASPIQSTTSMRQPYCSTTPSCPMYHKAFPPSECILRSSRKPMTLRCCIH